jgi:hypothetical protein
MSQLVTNDGAGMFSLELAGPPPPPPSPQGTRELKPLRVLAKAFLAQLFIDISVEVPLFINSMHF